MKPVIVSSTLSIILLFVCSLTSLGQMREDETVRESITVLNEIMAVPNQGIPIELLRDAKAVAVIPRVLKGSFIVGARHGDGVLLVRNPEGAWHAPVFISLTGGNIGYQIGVQSTDVILVFKTMQSVTEMLSRKLTLGADAAIAAGPVGRKAAAATDGQLKAQIFSYSRSRGLFAGVSLDGSVIQLNQMSNAVYYRTDGAGGPVIVPEAARRLTQQVSAYTQTQNVAQPQDVQNNLAVQPQQASFAQQHSREEIALVRDQLAKLAPRMYEKLNLEWQQYLALPAEVFYGNQHPSREKLNISLQRFETVKADTRYRDLINLPEFQSTYGLLKHYVTDLSTTKTTLNLPAPPGVRVGQRQTQ